MKDSEINFSQKSVEKAKQVDKEKEAEEDIQGRFLEWLWET